MSKLAIHGAEPVRKTPFPTRTPFGDDEIREVTQALRSQNLFSVNGQKTAAFEREFAARYGVGHAITSSSGTAAVHMAVAALGAEPGDEIITPAVTDFGTIAGILFQGLIPVFADWKPGALNMDPADIEQKITSRTRAVIVVHLFGNPCDMDAIMEIAGRHGIAVIEDCCQAYFTEYHGRLVGTIGDIGCFSMQQSKHLTAGEGGVCITNSENYAMRMRLFRDKGWENRAQYGPRAYSFLGLNYRMNELTGAVALAQLRKVEATVEAMNRLGEFLTGMIADIPAIRPAPRLPGVKHSYWLYAILIEGCDAAEFVRALAAENIPIGWGYTVDPIYLCTDALKHKRTFGSSSYPFTSQYTERTITYREGLCPVAERELKQIGVFRIYENWTESDIADVAAAVRKVAGELCP